jgi:membrane protease YdiL (CAAX protease family)
VNFRFSIKDTALSLSVSLLILLPFGYLMSRSGNAFSLLPAGSILFQLIGISLPEEVYFRGFLQERLGNTIGGIVIASLLFSIMHIPQVIMYGDIYSILTFFPSIVMGYLYMKTSSILPSTIFHFSSNIVWLGFITA